jgi:hypothetical protein
MQYFTSTEYWADSQWHIRVAVAPGHIVQLQHVESKEMLLAVVMTQTATDPFVGMICTRVQTAPFALGDLVNFKTSQILRRSNRTLDIARVNLRVQQIRLRDATCYDMHVHA